MHKSILRRSKLDFKKLFNYFAFSLLFLVIVYLAYKILNVLKMTIQLLKNKLFEIEFSQDGELNETVERLFLEPSSLIR